MPTVPPAPTNGATAVTPDDEDEDEDEEVASAAGATGGTGMGTPGAVVPAALPQTGYGPPTNPTGDLLVLLLISTGIGLAGVAIHRRRATADDTN
jgi:hypothetical protein